jgi:hypothetical protein
MLVYWIHLPSETDPLTEGYVGITKRSLITRFREHIRDKGLSEDHIIEVLRPCSSLEQAYSLEEHYRPTEDIGMNKNRGGDMPYPAIPKHAAWRQAISKSLSKPKSGAALIAARENLKKATAANTGKNKPKETCSRIAEGIRARYKSNPELWVGRPKKPVIADGVRYDGRGDCAKALGVSAVTVDNRIRSPKWDWSYE